MSVKDVTKLYQHPHTNDGWAISGYKIPVGNKLNSSSKGIVGYKALNVKKDKTYIGEIVYAAK